MPVVTLPDGSRRAFAQPVTVAEVAAAIGPGLARAALAGRVNGKLVDTSFRIAEDASLAIVTDKDPDGLEVIRHSTAHLLAQAVKALFPARAGDDRAGHRGRLLLRLRLRAALHARRPRRHREQDEGTRAGRSAGVATRTVRATRPCKLFRGIGENYKAEIIAGIPAGEEIGLYGQGDWFDLCRGPHVPSTGQAQGLQADEGGRRLLARRFAQRDACSGSTAPPGPTRSR